MNIADNCALTCNPLFVCPGDAVPAAVWSRLILDGFSAPLPSWAVLDQGGDAPRHARRTRAGRAAWGPTRRGVAGRR